MFRVFRLLALFGLLTPMVSGAVGIYDTLPETIHPGESYVIYSHGRIVEGSNPTPVSPEYGLYDFPAIKQALFAGQTFNLIAPQRPEHPDYQQYIASLESWVKRLLAAGVEPRRITLVGFSRGGQLTAVASSRLRREGINTVILAICEKGDFENDPPLVLGGNFLSIYETSDVVGSCVKLAARSHLASFKEIAISTGKKHGAFYQPLPEWLLPLKDWIARMER